MELYSAIDLHSNNGHVGIMDAQQNRVLSRKLANRPVRDLLRKRAHLVRVRTFLILSLPNIVMRNHGIKIHSNDLKKLTQDPVAELLKDQEELALAGKAGKETIDFLTRQIQRIERVAQNKAILREPFSKLLTLPGGGEILGMTILLETGPIERFKAVQYGPL